MINHSFNKHSLYNPEDTNKGVYSETYHQTRPDETLYRVMNPPQYNEFYPAENTRDDSGFSWFRENICFAESIATNFSGSYVFEIDDDGAETFIGIITDVLADMIWKNHCLTEDSAFSESERSAIRKDIILTYFRTGQWRDDMKKITDYSKQHNAQQSIG